MPSVAKPAVRSLVCGGLVATALLAGCASKHADTGPAPIGPATAATAPAPTATPTGEIRKLAGHPVAAIVDPATATLVVLGGADAGVADTLTVLGDDLAAPRAIALGAPATALTADGAGRVLVSTRGGYVSVDLAAGTAVRTGITGEQDTDFTAIARRSDGKLVLGSADGSVFVLSTATGVAHRDKLPSRVDFIVTQGNTAVVLERGQTSVTAVDPDGSAQEALRAGEGATTMAADPAGRVLVADTRGEELLVFGAEPLILRQRYPVRGAPYGIAGSQRLAWVSQTATNTVIGYDLATGIPVEKVRYPTVQQPNILAYDDASDTLYVVSGSGAGVQVIEHAGQPR
jgi:DNA-binding beta-propeller fold protein YncE